ncbi:MAG TPA: dephospho-CoA kinase [Thermodesulfobacteriota bacterium]|nr:dephospho-CoA kinase [Thermodesulfobacteriota bacterium]
MLRVGLTGGVASGKTAVSRVLKKEGAYIIDADQIARELVQPRKPAWREIIRAFGEEILEEDGSVHRKRLAGKVFADAKQRKRLNRILHPRIKKEMDRRTKEIGQRDPEAIVVIDAPLLIELGIHRQMDKLIVVTSTRAQQIKRLKDRDGANRGEAVRIVSAQMPLEEKLKFADFVIRNEGSLAETKRKARQVFKELKKVVHQTRKR